MSLIDRRIKGIPITFLVVLLLTVLLTIFFGAWAVSADVETQEKRLAFSVGSLGPNIGTVSPGTSDETADGDSASQEDSDTLADEWWGNALLKVCPFH